MKKKEILWESQDAEDKIVNKKEVEFIEKYRSNEKRVGYNQWPKAKST
jgi:hypothetical protein